jgi:hypothetical protein
MKKNEEKNQKLEILLRCNFEFELLHLKIIKKRYKLI